MGMRFGSREENPLEVIKDRASRRGFIRGTSAAAAGVGAAMYVKPSLQPLGVTKAYAASATGPGTLPPPPPAAVAGLSPGYYKKDVHYPPTGYAPTTKLDSVFTFPAGFDYGTLPASTFHDVLNNPGGGPTLADQANVMFFQVLAALLNAESVAGYPYTTAEIISATNYALANPGTAPNYAGLADVANQLALYNK